MKYLSTAFAILVLTLTVSCSDAIANDLRLADYLASDLAVCNFFPAAQKNCLGARGIVARNCESLLPERGTSTISSTVCKAFGHNARPRLHRCITTSSSTTIKLRRNTPKVIQQT